MIVSSSAKSRGGPRVVYKMFFMPRSALWLRFGGGSDGEKLFVGGGGVGGVALVVVVVVVGTMYCTSCTSMMMWIIAIGGVGGTCFTRWVTWYWLLVTGAHGLLVVALLCCLLTML